MKFPTQIAALSLACALSACVAVPLHGIPLEWTPSAPPDFGSVDVSGIGHTTLRVLPFTDARTNPLIGENREDPQPKTVTTNADIGAFVARHLAGVLAQAGVQTVQQGGAAVLSGEVQQFFVLETSTYQGVVNLHCTLRNAAGNVLWEGTTNGTSKHFGHSYSADNYYQTLSDALVNAATALVDNAQFRAALASAGASRGT